MAAHQQAPSAITAKSLIKDHPDAEHIRRAISRITSILGNIDNLSIYEFCVVAQSASGTLNEICNDLGKGANHEH